MVRIPIAPERHRVTIPAAVSRMRRTVRFRGDTDTAFRRAAEFVGETLKDAMPKP
jgi:hypothetical protein